jgi:4-hydroxy-2-oxoheptanedioate aldolase
MALDDARELLASGRPSFGAIVTMPSPQVMRILAGAGFDVLIIDMEHGPIDLATAHTLILATAGTPAAPMVRIAANTPWLAKPLLDMGAVGIAVPMVGSRAEAEAAARALRYPPEGERMWGPFHAPFRWDLSMRDYMRAANRAVLSIVAVEHIDAVNRIDEIVAAEGIDVIVIGPGDLATSMGLLGQIDHPDVQAAIRAAEKVVLKSGVALGGVAFSSEQANRMIDQGYRSIYFGFDWSMLARGAAAVLDGVRRP